MKKTFAFLAALLISAACYASPPGSSPPGDQHEATITSQAQAAVDFVYNAPHSDTTLTTTPEAITVHQSIVLSVVSGYPKTVAREPERFRLCGEVFNNLEKARSGETTLNEAERFRLCGGQRSIPGISIEAPPPLKVLSVRKHGVPGEPATRV